MSLYSAIICKRPPDVRSTCTLMRRPHVRVPLAAILLLESAPQESCKDAHEDLSHMQKTYPHDFSSARVTAFPDHRPRKPKREFAGDCPAGFALFAAWAKGAWGRSFSPSRLGWAIDP